jgi:hypothetical protein
MFSFGYYSWLVNARVLFSSEVFRGPSPVFIFRWKTFFGNSSCYGFTGLLPLLRNLLHGSLKFCVAVV